MIPRQSEYTPSEVWEKIAYTPSEVWEKIAAPISSEAVQWRVDGKPTSRDGKFYARFVAYVDAQFVRERLDSVVPGEWDLTLEMLPPSEIIGPGGEVKGREFSFKARLQILGVIREDVGSGDDYKTAASDAFKRAAVRFGVAHDLYGYEQNWVEVDSDSKYAKPVEDPQRAYERRHGSGAKSAASSDNPAPGVAAGGASALAQKAKAAASTLPNDQPAPTVEPLGPCPKCGGRVWDNRLTKRNPRAPDGKCQNRSCDGVIWPPKETKAPGTTPTSNRQIDDDDVRGSLQYADDLDREELPF